MKSITFTIHSSTGSSEERYSRYIMIDKPKMSISFYFNEEDLDILEIQSVNDIGVIALSIINSENHVDSFYGQFYRESDYFGHEKNALDSATDYIFIPKQ